MRASNATVAATSSKIFVSNHLGAAQARKVHSLGATVYKLVLTVEYPMLCTICGRKLFTLARGTPNEKLIAPHTQ